MSDELIDEKPLGACLWNGNEIVQVSEPNKGVAGLAGDSPDSWGRLFAAAPELRECVKGLFAGAMVTPERMEKIRNVLATIEGDL